MAGAPQLKVFLAGRVAVQIDGAPDTANQFSIGYVAQPGFVLAYPGAGPGHFVIYNGDDVLDCVIPAV